MYTEKQDKTVNSLMTTRQAATLLNVHSSTIRHWCHTGILKLYMRDRAGGLRFSCEDVQGLLKKRGVK